MANIKIISFIKYMLLVNFVSFMLSCSNETKFTSVIYKNLDHKFIDTLGIDSKQVINFVEINMSGRVSDSAKIYIENGSGRWNEILLNDNINEKYKTEWYENNIIIRFVPSPTQLSVDSLRIDYRFY